MERKGTEPVELMRAAAAAPCDPLTEVVETSGVSLQSCLAELFQSALQVLGHTAAQHLSVCHPDLRLEVPLGCQLLLPGQLVVAVLLLG